MGKEKTSDELIEEGKAEAAEVKRTPEEVKAELADAMKAAQASAKTERPDELPKGGVGILRRKGSSNRSQLTASDIPYPEGIHGENYEFYGPHGFASFIPDGTDISTYSNEQEFVIDPERVRVLFFEQAGRNLPKKRLYNIKGIHKDGRIVPLPFEDQIQNNAGGDPEDAIGLHRYERKGIYLLMDWETMIPIYCAAWGCFAQAQQKGENVAFCSLRHAQHTLPNRYKEKGAEVGMMGMFSQGSTTSRVWSQ